MGACLLLMPARAQRVSSGPSPTSWGEVSHSHKVWRHPPTRHSHVVPPSYMWCPPQLEVAMLEETQRLEDRAKEEKLKQVRPGRGWCCGCVVVAVAGSYVAAGD